MSEDKTKGELAPSTNPEERPDLQDYKSKDKGSTSTSNSAKTTDFDSITTVPTPEGDVQVETKLEIPVDDFHCLSMVREYYCRSNSPPCIRTSHLHLPFREFFNE
jgi:hypothetical protein